MSLTHRRLVFTLPRQINRSIQGEKKYMDQLGAAAGTLAICLGCDYLDA